MTLDIRQKGKSSLGDGKQMEEPYDCPSFLTWAFPGHKIEQETPVGAWQTPWEGEEKVLRIQGHQGKGNEEEKAAEKQTLRDQWPLRYSAEYLSMHVSKLPKAREETTEKD